MFQLTDDTYTSNPLWVVQLVSEYLDFLEYGHYSIKVHHDLVEIDCNGLTFAVWHNTVTVDLTGHKLHLDDDKLELFVTSLCHIAVNSKTHALDIYKHVELL